MDAFVAANGIGLSHVADLPGGIAARGSPAEILRRVRDALEHRRSSLR